MADKRNIRRDAERKAREALGGDLVTTVGDLAMAADGRTTAADAMDQARVRGGELIAIAKRQAEELAADAQRGLDAVEQDYAARYTAARDAGWTTTQLTGLGYTRAATRKPNTRETASPAEPELSAAS